jgi:hypothetical protein
VKMGTGLNWLRTGCFERGIDASFPAESLLSTTLYNDISHRFFVRNA